MADRIELVDRLARLIIEKEALKFGDFTLASGRKSDYYIDGRIVGLTGEGSYLMGEIMLSMLEEEFPEATAVGGLVAGAVPVAAAVARASYGKDKPIDAFMVRKEVKKHGAQRIVEGPLSPGAKVVVVDDVITSGGSTITAIEHTQDFGCDVLGVICVVDREEEKVAGFEKFKYSPILTISRLREYNKMMFTEK